MNCLHDVRVTVLSTPPRRFVFQDRPRARISGQRAGRLSRRLRASGLLISPPRQHCHCRPTIGEPRAAIVDGDDQFCRVLVWARSMQRVGVTPSWTFRLCSFDRAAPASAALLYVQYLHIPWWLINKEHCKSTAVTCIQTHQTALIFNPAMNCGITSQPPLFVWIFHASWGC